MNLLFYLSRYPGWGGIETVTYLIVPELLKLGYKVDIVSHRQEYGAQPEIPDVALYKMPYDSFYCEGNVAYVNRLLTQRHYDAIIYQDCYEPSERIVVEMSQKFDIPLVVFEHSTPLYARKNLFPESLSTLKGLLQRLYFPYLTYKKVKLNIERKKYLYSSCLKYVMLSSQYVPEFKSLLNICDANSKVTYINNPIVMPSLPDDIVERKKELLYVGQLVKIKNVSKILKLWKILNEDLPDYCLTIVGDGPEREQLENNVLSLNLPRVRFEGYQSPVAYYQRAKFLLMTSRFEGWPMTVLEAMSFGCIPMVEFTFSSLVDIVDNEENGFILPANCSLRIWRKKLIEAIGDEIKLALMRKEARKRVQRFTCSKIAGDWDSLLSKLKCESN